MTETQTSSGMTPFEPEGSTYVIAEIGVNHDGSLNKALELINAVADAGADAIKVQTFNSETLASAHAPKANYQLETTHAAESQLQMLKRLELSREDHWTVMAAAQRRGLDFLSTPYDPDSLEFLVEELGVTQIKIASSDITNLPLLLAAGRSRKRVILSTGMSTMGEIRQALATIGFGGTTTAGTPSTAILESTDIPGAPKYLAESVVMLQCTSQYPAPINEANLSTIATMRDLFGVPIGYSDHTVGIVTALMSVAYGSVMYERHFTLDRNAPGPDHAASMEPAEFTSLISLLREAEAARGTGVKEPTPSEAGNRHPMRKSLFAARSISEGQLINEDDIATMRPADGDSPAHYWEWLGKPSPRSFSVGDSLNSYWE
jgi:N-acetylneuraminate synthase